MLHPFDLHVLGLPLAFILSQDQTLHCIKILIPSEDETMSSADPTRLCKNSVLTCYASLAQLLKEASELTNLSFPVIQRTYALPVGRTLWQPNSLPFLCYFPSVLSFGVAKVRSFFQFARKRKIFYSLFLGADLLNPLPVEADCKGKQDFFRGKNISEFFEFF